MKGKIFFIILISIIVLTILTTCRGVIFDEDITSTLFTASKMNLETTIGPVRFDEECIYADDEYTIWYLPEKGMFNTGYIIKEDEYGYLLLYFSDPNIDSIQAYYLNRYQEDNHPGIFFEPVPEHPGNLFVINFAETESYSLIQYNWETNMLSNVYENSFETKIYGDFSGMLSLAYEPELKGAFISPFDNRLYVSIYHDNYSAYNAYYSISYDIDPLLLTDLLTNERAEYGGSYIDLGYEIWDSYYFFFDFTENRSIISTWEDTSYTSFYWDESVTQNNITNSINPITTLLTSSDLLVLEDAYAKVYGIDGTFDFEFYLGDLKFMYEYYDGSRYLSVFTYTYAYYYHDDCHETEFYFNVYTIPTDELQELDN